MRGDLQATDEWTTLVPAHLLTQFGVNELHAVLFEPNDDRGGMRNVVIIQIPETPPREIRLAMRQATMLDARVMFLCDSRKQALTAAADGARGLPKHHRIALERASQGGWGALSL